MHKSLKFLIPAFMAFTLAACGGSSSGKSDTAEYSGKTTPANLSFLSEAKKSQLAEESTNIVFGVMEMAVPEKAGFDPSGDKLPNGVVSASTPKVKTINTAELSRAIFKIHEQNQGAQQLPLGVRDNGEEVCSTGSVSWDETGSEETSGSIKIIYKKCKIEFDFGGLGDIFAALFENEESILGSGLQFSFSIEQDGQLLGKWTPTSYEIEFKNYQITFVDSGESDTIKMHGTHKATGISLYQNESNATYSASWNMKTSFDGISITSIGEMDCKENTCTANTTLKMPDGKTYKAEGLKITTDRSGDIIAAEGKAYHPDYGYYTFELNVTGETCDDDDFPFEGSVILTDENSNRIEYGSFSCGTEPSVM